MVTRLLLASVCASVLLAPSDLDGFMQKVMERRDDNWKKLQQYVLEEKEAFDLRGPGGFPLWGLRREYSWFIRDGIFVRSPLTADGVKLSESDRKKAEAAWIAREQKREARARQRDQPRASNASDEAPSPQITNTEDLLKQMREPQFVSSAYFLRFKFESGRYALAGREQLGDIQALKVEYYPQTGLFNEGRTKPDRKAREDDERINRKMNKVSMVTLWIDPATYQILQYTFDNIDMDFLPGRALVRLDDLEATMKMAQAFPNVWLPKTIEMHFGMVLALGPIDATYKVEYLNYKEAAVTYRIK